LLTPLACLQYEVVLFLFLLVEVLAPSDVSEYVYSGILQFLLLGVLGCLSCHLRCLDCSAFGDQEVKVGLASLLLKDLNIVGCQFWMMRFSDPPFLQGFDLTFEAH
jgi:hypothetical protein